MFEALFSRAQKTVEISVERAVTRALMALPFLAALAFGAAALSICLVQDYGAIGGFGAMAGLFALLGLVVWAVSAFGSTPVAPESPAETDLAAPSESRAQIDATTSPVSDVDRELILAALTSAAPIAVPGLTRMMVRNLPLILAAAAALFVLSRPAVTTASEDVPRNARPNGSVPPNSYSPSLAPPQ